MDSSPFSRMPFIVIVSSLRKLHLRLYVMLVKAYLHFVLLYILLLSFVFSLFLWCNCIVTLLSCDCKCFCKFYQILSNLPHSISYFAQSFCCFLSTALHFYYFQSHTVLHLSPVYPSSHNLVLFALLLPPAMSSAS